MSTRREESNSVVEAEDVKEVAAERAQAFAAQLATVVKACSGLGDDLTRHAIGCLRDTVMGD